MKEDSLRKKLDGYLKVVEYTSKQALEALSLLIFSFDYEENDLFILAKLLNPEDIAKIVYYFNGASLKVPSIEEYKRSKLLACCYYLREIKGWDWPKIKRYLSLLEEDLDDSTTRSVGIKIAKIKNELRPDFLKVLIDNYDFDRVVNDFVGKTQ
jgi:hypothetical protein